jgi:hypothetical protein
VEKNGASAQRLESIAHSKGVSMKTLAVLAACTAALGLSAARPAAAQQVPDPEYQPAIAAPAYAPGTGPVVCVDEAHHNFHTLGERFRAFGELLRRDGYVLRANAEPFAAASLRECAILVIANAQPGSEDWDSYPYPTPSAFAAEEIAAVRAWVEDGGALLLIADHMPLAGAASGLAAAFGVEFKDGFAYPGFTTDAELEAASARPTLFVPGDGTLAAHAIVRGRDAGEAVPQVRSFTGQAFRAPADAEPLLVLPADYVLVLPEKAWQFDANTRRIAVGGWLQGAVLQVGRGRAAFFGEAAMFTAQRAGPERRPMGMNAPMAEHNHRLVLNLAHWLSGLLP